MPLLLVGGLAAAVIVVAAVVSSGVNPLSGPSVRGSAALNAAKRQMQGAGAGRIGNTGRRTTGTFLGIDFGQSPSGYSAPPPSFVIAPTPGGPGTVEPTPGPITNSPSSSFTAAPPPYEETLGAPYYSWLPGQEAELNPGGESIGIKEQTYTTPGSDVAPGQTPIFYSNPVTGDTSPTPQPGYAPIY